MNVACLTFHDSSNYGSALQAYALQKTVSDMGHNYNIIDYSTPEKAKYDSLLGRNVEMSKGTYLYKLAAFPFNFIKKYKFRKFSKNYLYVTDTRYKTTDQLKSLQNSYDFYFCGSDQIWNAGMVRYDSAYWLSFVQDKSKIASYAASFGISDIPPNDWGFYNRQMEPFSYISVREASAQNILLNEFNKPSVVVLDPTLLLTKDDWALLASPNKSQGYILSYSVNGGNSALWETVSRLQKKTRLPHITIYHSFYSLYKSPYLRIPSPKEWLSLFFHASYVVTDSFHATAFSTNLERPFFSFIEPPENKASNARIVDFLKMTGLSERLLTLEPGDPNLPAPDFSTARNMLNEKRKESISFIKNCLV